MQPNFCIFTDNIQKLSDLMIPLPVFNSMVQYIEGLPDFGLIRRVFVSDTESHDITKDTYVLPYPYMEPLYDSRRLNEIENEGARAKVLEEWKHKVFIRASTFAENGLSSDTINSFDSDPDQGAIVHITSGVIILFHYSCIEDLQVLNMHCRIPQIYSISKSISPENVSASMVAFYSYLMDARYRQIYAFTYKKQDSFNPNGQGILATVLDHTAMPLDIATKVADNLIRSVHNHKKIILTA